MGKNTKKGHVFHRFQLQNFMNHRHCLNSIEYVWYILNSEIRNLQETSTKYLTCILIVIKPHDTHKSSKSDKDYNLKIC